MRALTSGDIERARAQLANGATRPLLNTALRTYLDGDRDGRVYDQPAAFTAFIRGGGNVGLYDAVTGALAARYRQWGVTSLVDIGSGDGRAVLPALAATPVAAVTLVEPSTALLDAALAAAPDGVTGFAGDAAAFVAAFDGRADLTQSTFALHTLPHGDRSSMLSALRPHVTHLALAEFDVPGRQRRAPHVPRRHLRAGPRGVRLVPRPCRTRVSHARPHRTVGAGRPAQHPGSSPPPSGSSRSAPAATAASP